MSRIASTLNALKARGEKALVTFITAGDPDLTTSEQLVHSLVESGADLIELGFPFSDPMADGPTIQLSSERALAAWYNSTWSPRSGWQGPSAQQCADRSDGIL